MNHGPPQVVLDVHENSLRRVANFENVGNLVVNDAADD